MHVQFSGRYRLQVFHGDTDILLKDTGWFDNLITDNGLNLLGTGFVVTGYVGSDTAAPTTADTSIANVLSSAGGVYVNGGVQAASAPYYGWIRFSFTYGIGAIVGTIGQVAIGNNSASNLFSKAQLTTSAGVPTTLTLGAIDRLVLTYELRQCINTSDVSGSLAINGTTYSYTGRPCEIDLPQYWRPWLGSSMGVRRFGTQVNSGLRTNCTALGTVLTAPDGTYVAASSATTGAYVSGSLQAVMTETWAIGAGNLANINAFEMSTMGQATGAYSMGGRWQFLLDGSVAKTQYQNLTIEWAYTWGRCA